MDKRGRDRSTEASTKEKRPNKSPRKKGSARRSARDESDSPPAVPAVAHERPNQYRDAGHPVVASSSHEPAAPSPTMIERYTSAFQKGGEDALSSEEEPGLEYQLTQVPSNSGNQRQLDRKSGKVISERFTNFQVYRLVKLCEEETEKRHKGWWPIVTRLWNDEFRDNPASVRALRGAYYNLNEGDRISTNLKAAIDAGIPIPKRGAPVGSALYSNARRWNLTEQHINWLKENHGSSKSWPELTNEFSTRFPEMKDIFWKTLKSYALVFGCVSGEGMRRLTTEQKLYALKLYNSHGRQDMSESDRNIVCDKFRETFGSSQPLTSTKKTLRYLFDGFGNQDGKILEERILKEEQERKSKRAEKQQHIKESRVRSLRKKIWRTLLDVEILKTAKNADSGDSIKEKADKIRLTNAYHQLYGSHGADK